MAGRLNKDEIDGKQAWAQGSSIVNIRPSNRPIKNLCLVFMTGSAVLAMMAQDVWFILQSIAGIIIAVEGLHGVSKYDTQTLRRFIAVLFVSGILAMAIGIVELQTVEDYCSTAPEAEKDDCIDTIVLYYVSFISIQTVLGLLIAIVVSFFHSAIISLDKKARDKFLDDLYMNEMDQLEDE